MFLFSWRGPRFSLYPKKCILFFHSTLVAVFCNKCIFIGRNWRILTVFSVIRQPHYSRARMHTHTHTRARTHTHTNTNTHACTHTRARTHTHEHTHALILSQSLTHTTQLYASCRCMIHTTRYFSISHDSWETDTCCNTYCDTHCNTNESWDTAMSQIS